MWSSPWIQGASVWWPRHINVEKTVGGATGVQGRIWDPLGRTFIGRQRTSVHELRKFSGRAGEQLTCTRFIVEGGKRTLRSSWVWPNLRLWRRHRLKIWGNLCRYTGRDAVWFRTSGLTQTCPEMITALYITGCLGFKVRTAPLYWQTEVVVPFGGLPGRRLRVRPEPAGLVRKASEVWNTAQPAGDLTLMDGYVFTSRHFWWALGSERSLFL